MKDDDWLLIAVLALGLYFLWKHENATVRVTTPATPANGVPPPVGTGTASGVTQTLPSPASGLTVSSVATTATKTAESAVSSYTHVPLSAVGSAAQRAPTWAKIAIFPVGVTAITQDVIDNPVGSVKGAASAVASGATTAAKAVGGAASSAYHAFTSLF